MNDFDPMFPSNLARAIPSGAPVAVAFSGGVDSAVTALLLKEAGCRVRGVHMILNQANRNSGGSALPELHRLAEAVGIPLEAVSLEDAFRSFVVRYYEREVASGRTPNPCVVCNPAIKFGLLLSHIRDAGSRYLATGHYARVGEDPIHRLPFLAKGADSGKDQSYFLHRLSQAQLSQALFPLGARTKSEVRRIALDRGILHLVQAESRDFCFFHQEAGRAVIDRTNITPGPLVDSAEKVLGTHKGIQHYTVGQRRGLNLPSTEPYYVLSMDAEHNRVVVGRKRDLYRSEALVCGIHWISEIPKRDPFGCHVRIRYRHTETPAEVVPLDPSRARIRFEVPQRAVTPGQAAVFYEGNTVLGGGWLE